MEKHTFLLREDFFLEGISKIDVPGYSLMQQRCGFYQSRWELEPQYRDLHQLALEAGGGGGGEWLIFHYSDA